MPADWQLPPLRGKRFEMAEPAPADIVHLADHLCPGDREEVYATSGHRDYRAILRRCVAASDSARVAVAADGEPLAIVGVGTLSVLYNVGSPWMLITERGELYRRSLVTAGRAYTAAMLEQYGRLENKVDARNARSVAWLRHLGYHIEPAAPHGAFGLPFHPFWIERTPHV